MAVRPTRYTDEKLVTATGKTWKQWLAVLNKIGAGNLSQKEIAKALHEKHGTTPWWAQSLTIQYEQESGKRKPGENCDGNFQLGVSKTVSLDRKKAFNLFCQKVPRKKLNAVTVSQAPSTNLTEKWSYWRASLGDGSKVSLIVGTKSTGKSSVAISHDKLANAKSVEAWREYWKALLAKVFGG